MRLLQRDVTQGQRDGRMHMKFQWQDEHILLTLFKGNRRKYNGDMKLL